MVVRDALSAPRADHRPGPATTLASTMRSPTSTASARLTSCAASASASARVSPPRRCISPRDTPARSRSSMKHADGRLRFRRRMLRRRNRASPRGGPNRRARGGCGSSTTPPPIVASGEYAPQDEPVAACQDGRRLEPDARVDRAGGRIALRPPRATRPSSFARPVMKPHARAVAQRLRVRQQIEPPRRAGVSARTRPARTSVSPRVRSATSTPPRFTATRRPAPARGSRCPCTCRPRTLTGALAGSDDQLLVLARSVPDTSVPVTTVPNPFDREHAIDRQPHGPVRLSGGGDARQHDQSARSASSPCARPRRHGDDRARWRETIRDQLARFERHELDRLRIDEVRLASGRSRRPGRCSSRQISKCSRVCGITDSSAATTSSTRSIPPAPASMFLTKRSWPGTSTNAQVDVAVTLEMREPRSMVMPRACSSLSARPASGSRARSARAPARSCRDRCARRCR